MRPVIRDDGLAGCQPVVTQDKIRYKAIRDREGEVRLVVAIEGGEVEVHDGVLDACYPERARKIESVDDSCGYARSVIGGDKKDVNSGLSDRSGK